jgi:undecaprenyl-diphosphatase
VIGSAGLVWIALGLLAAVVLRRPPIFFVVMAGVFLADLLALGLKALTSRSRPYIRNPDQDPLLGATLDLSLPSGHASTSFAGATMLARYAPRFAIPLYALAAGIGWSRVYVGVHYPFDVFAGAVLGVVVGAALLYALRGWPRVRPGPAKPRGLQLFARLQKPGHDHGERRRQTDPDADPASVGGQEALGDGDQANEDEDRRK